jgi:hypothetical protein
VVLVDDAARRCGIANDQWPVDQGLPLDLLADPACHLLHRALRLHARAEPDGARRALKAAFAHLAGAPESAPWHALIAAAATRGGMSGMHVDLAKQATAALLPGSGLEAALAAARASPQAVAAPRPALSEVPRSGLLPHGKPPLL